MEQSAAEL